MLDLWRKTIELFRKYPVLWVPYVCADLATSCLSWLRQSSAKAIFHWVTTVHLHSVLGGDLVTTTNFDRTAMVKASLLAIPVEWGTRYASACFYVVALILTASLVVMALRGEKPNLAAARPTLRNYPKRIFLFSLIFCALTVLLAALIAFTPSYLLTVKDPTNQALFKVVTIGGELLVMLCSAGIMAPIAIALIRPIDAISVSPERKKLGRKIAMLLGTAMITLEQLSNLLMSTIGHISKTGLAFLGPFDSLVVNSPFILLFIALALIAAEDSLESRIESVPSTHKLLETLMPLHFGQREER